MLRFYPSIYLDDKVLVAQTMSRDVVFHDIPHLSFWNRLFIRLGKRPDGLRI